MGVRRAAAVNAARISALASRALGRGGGTALPGLIATALDPAIVADLTAQLPGGSVVVSGTNGKTTTARILASILTDAGYTPLRNESGSNLSRGLASSLVRETGITGNIAAHERALGLFEVDEAALPEVLSSIRPTRLVLLDLFRDQLDRYGEVATVAGLWKTAIASLPRETRIVANADDPLVADVAGAAPGPVTYFGLESAERAAGAEHASDVKACPRCGGPVRYSRVFLGHLGHYCCTRCDFTRPTPSVAASNVVVNGVEGATFQVTDGGAPVEVAFPLPGMYNVYNAVSALATASSMQVDLNDASRSLAHVTPAFGRMERLEIDGHSVFLALAKNPAGLNEVMRTIAQGGESLHLLVMLNDNIADGRDVSWIWDADVEALAGRVRHAVFAGTRAEDIALRFKYAGVIAGSSDWVLEHDTRTALRSALAQLAPDARLFIVPTYTAMLDVRNTLARLGYVRQYWEE